MTEFDTPLLKTIDADELKTYIDAHHEKNYVLIDVRQPEEYQTAHIPGARFIPLMEFETRLFELPPEKDLVFYCRSGSRSMAAAVLAAETEVTSGTVYNLAGGIMAWFGKTLPDFPKIQVFDRSADLTDQLYVAMDLEKGAWRFYHSILQRYAVKSFSAAFQKLSKAETAHAKAVYGFWKQLQDDPPPFESLFDQLPGHILEGGEPVESLLDRLAQLDDNVCLGLIEMSLDIEYAAFDLYRTMAHRATDNQAQEAFTAIAQAEKGHMKVLANATAHCGRG